MGGAALRGVLFDKDGTLIDFDGTWLPIYERMTRRLSGGRPELALELMVMAGSTPTGDALLPGSVLVCGSTAELGAIWNQHPEVSVDVAALDALVLALSAELAVPLAPLGPLFGTLRARGMTLGVATMDSTASARQTMAALGVSGLLDFCVGYDAGHGGKPGPGMVLGFCAAAGLAPAQVAVVGDTLHDVHMARAAGAGLAVGVSTGTTPRAELEAAADHVLDALEELPALLEAWA